MEGLLEKEKSLEDRFRFALELTGNDGKFQIIIFNILLLASFISSLTVTILPFHKEIPELFCVDRNDFEDDIIYDIYKRNNNFKIFHEEDCVKKHCSNFPNFVNERLTVLVADYSKLGNFITELDMLCDSEPFFIDFSQYLFIGRIIGLLVFSYISDKYGRYISFFLLIFILLFCNLGYFFFKDKILFLFLGLASNACMFLWNLVCLMSTEMMSERLYNLANSLITTAFSLTGMLNIIFMYFFSDWNVILIFQISIILILLYLSKQYMTETTSFLLYDKQYIELVKTIEFISSKNNDKAKHQTVLDELDKIKQIINIDLKLADDKLSMKEKKGFNLKEVIKSVLGPYLIIFKSFDNIWNIVKILLPYASGIFIYYGQLFYIEEIPGSIYFNLSLVFTAEIIFELISGQLLLVMEKKTVLILSCLISTVGCFVVFIYENEKVKLAMVFFITMCNAINFVALAVFLADNFDVSVKSTSSSLVSLISYFFMMFSGNLVNAIGSSYLTFGILSFFATINVIFIKDRKLNAGGPCVH